MADGGSAYWWQVINTQPFHHLSKSQRTLCIEKLNVAYKIWGLSDYFLDIIHEHIPMKRQYQYFWRSDQASKWITLTVIKFLFPRLKVVKQQLHIMLNVDIASKIKASANRMIKLKVVFQVTILPKFCNALLMVFAQCGYLYRLRKSEMYLLDVCSISVCLTILLLND